MYRVLLLLIFFSLNSFSVDIKLVKSYQDSNEEEIIELEPYIDMEIDDITLKSGDDNFTVSYKNVKKSVTLYFLIDSSYPMRRAFKEGINPLIKRLYRQKGSKEKWVVSRFDIDLEVIYNEYDLSPSSLISRLDSLKIKGQRTELWKNLEKSIEFLNKIKDDTKKVLIICSDGESEDPAYKIETSIEKALKSNITIVSLGYRDIGTKKTNFIQNMERIAKDTYGKFWSANGKNRLPPDFDAEFSKFIHKLSSRNILVEIPSEAIEPTKSGKRAFTLNIEHDNNKITELNFEIDVPKIDVFFNRYIYPILGIAILLLLLIYIFTPTKGKKSQNVVKPVEPKTPNKIENVSHNTVRIKLQNSNIDNSEEKHIAYFEDLKGMKYYLYRVPSTIGSKGDIVIKHQYVSREHAIINIKNGYFIIEDKGSKNGLYINGLKVKSKRIDSGDKVSFGPYDTVFRI